MRCEVDPSLVAVWCWSSHSPLQNLSRRPADMMTNGRLAGSDALCLRLSALAAAVLSDAHKLKLSELEPHRPKEYDTRKQATDPITGGASEILRTVANYYMGIGQLFINPPKGVINTATAIPKVRRPRQETARSKLTLTFLAPPLQGVLNSLISFPHPFV